MITGAQVMAKAREYLGTRFQHQGRIKGHGIDCVGLPLMVGQELGLLDIHGVPILANDSRTYSAQPLDGFVHSECQRRLIEVPLSEMAEGCVLTIKNPTIACHAGIASTVTGVPGVIHSHRGIGRVVEHLIDADLRGRILGCFKFPGVE